MRIVQGMFVYRNDIVLLYRLSMYRTRRFCQDMLYGNFCFVCDKSNNVMEDTQIVQGRSVNRNDWRFCQDMSHGIFGFVCDKSHNVMEDTQIVQGRSVNRNAIVLYHWLSMCKIERFLQDMLYGIFCFVCDKSRNVMEYIQIVQGRYVYRNNIVQYRLPMYRIERFLAGYVVCFVVIFKAFSDTLCMVTCSFLCFVPSNRLL